MSDTATTVVIPIRDQFEISGADDPPDLVVVWSTSGQDGSALDHTREEISQWKAAAAIALPATALPQEFGFWSEASLRSELAADALAEALCR